MKKLIVFVLVFIITALSLNSVSAAYYDQDGNKHWCHTDSYGCWISGENGEHEYIMFWSEAARTMIMGPDSNAPLADIYGHPKLPLKPPQPPPTSGSFDVCAALREENCGVVSLTCAAWDDVNGEPVCICPCDG